MLPSEISKDYFNMRQSQLFTKTQKETPRDEKSVNAKLLLRGGFIHKEMAGVYTFLPLGFLVLRKIENIIREEMNRIGGQEILMPVLQPKYLWQKTGRWKKGIGEVMYKTLDSPGKEFALGPTHEEILTNIISKYVKSYLDLPLAIYQIQTKFRKEPRARSGLLRGREFGMKDLYSFHPTEQDFKNYYNLVKKSYFRILKRCGLKTIFTEASGAGFTEGFTHEFQVISQGGEDTIVYCSSFHFSQNKEISKSKKGDQCPVCKKILKQSKSIEAGNIFPLGTKYSRAMRAFFINKDGKKKLIIMGSYGIGISRMMGAVVEVFHDEKGIIWPKEIAPFQIHLIEIENTREVKKAAEKLYQDLSSFAPRKRSYGGPTEAFGIGGQKANFEVLYDDRIEKTAGEKFADCDLIGIPTRLVVSERTLAKNSVEIKKRREKKIRLVKINNIKQTLS